MASTPSTHVSVLMVCMGNICRSPMAEAVFRHLVTDAGLEGRVTIDSAGTHSYHLGHTPHPETQAELARRGVEVGEQISRLVTVSDLDVYDFVVVMDDANLDGVREVAQQAGGEARIQARIVRLLDYAPEVVETEVPDPYYVGGYDVVYDLVDAGCRGLLTAVEAELAHA
ncbi:MAG: low molecular weight phosphotyrosine protein phosphatase [Thermoleophilia bacterium]|nr:low molecular weight phosphotyrosine protein phosphatase [Thermoleophilia bacterium]